jgi:hypothetical protein
VFCGRCCVMEPRSGPALWLDIFIEILLSSSVNDPRLGAVSKTIVFDTHVTERPGRNCLKRGSPVSVSVLYHA